jgi:ATP-binding cassette subfamily B protein
LASREFAVDNAPVYNRTSPLRWILSHARHYAYLPVITVLASILSNSLLSYSSVLVGQAFAWITGPDPALADLLRIATLVAGARLGQGALSLGRSLSAELLAQRLERDCRDELYVSLLGKSLTYHGRQRVGDLMARATNDVHQVNLLINPASSLIFESFIGLLVPIITMALLRLELVLVPLMFVALWILSVRDYTRRLNPVSDAIREQFGTMNAGLAEALIGIEVVKVNAQERQEAQRFLEQANRYRDVYVRRGEIQARYVPMLVYSVCSALALLHAFLVYLRGDGFGLGDVVAYMGLFTLLRSPTFLSLFTFTLLQMGISGAARILQVLNDETTLDENPDGVKRPMRGEVVFDRVTFGYRPETPVLQNISFYAAPGETIAIVGSTGSGKTSLTHLINRIYDVDRGAVRVDGIDTRDWNLESLRSQISTIEQDVFIFSRTIAENIAFGVGSDVDRAEIERAAREAQAHDFIMAMPQGYDTEVGERGVTLSGGQRQRLAMARAFLTDPRILILDDSTSAIDSATEDEIQKAMYRVRQGRTTFLITHRLSQIRWADRILVLRRGELVDQGTHEELAGRCAEYQRILRLVETESA